MVRLVIVPRLENPVKVVKLCSLAVVTVSVSSRFSPLYTVRVAVPPPKPEATLKPTAFAVGEKVIVSGSVNRSRKSTSVGVLKKLDEEISTKEEEPLVASVKVTPAKEGAGLIKYPLGAMPSNVSTGKPGFAALKLDSDVKKSARATVGRRVIPNSKAAGTSLPKRIVVFPL